MSRVVLWLLHLQETILLPRNVEIHWTRKNHRCKTWQVWKTRVLRYHSSSKSLVSTCPYCRILRTPQSLSNHSLRPQSRSRSILQWKGSSQLPHHRGSCLSYCQSNKLLSEAADSEAADSEAADSEADSEAADSEADSEAADLAAGTSRCCHRFYRRRQVWYRHSMR